jgi:predicted cobalt transporter CbtA
LAFCSLADLELRRRTAPQFLLEEAQYVVGTLLSRGMLVGILAGILSFCFLKVVGEPQVDRAIAFENAMDAAKYKANDGTAKGMSIPKEGPEPELVSRPVQAGIGLFTGVVIYSTAFGGLFALVFAFAHGRMDDFDPKMTSALLALSGIIAVYIVPSLKYPANPPSVGDPETIGARTALYFVVIAISIAAIIAAWLLRSRLVPHWGRWNATLVGAAAYLVVVVVVGLALPSVNEVPEAFPAVLLWQFRIATAGAQFVMWSTIGLGFGILAERVTARRSGL